MTNVGVIFLLTFDTT